MVPKTVWVKHSLWGPAVLVAYGGSPVVYRLLTYFFVALWTGRIWLEIASSTTFTAFSLRICGFGFFVLNCYTGNSLAVQWLGLRAFTAEGPGSIPGRGTKIPQAAWCGKKQKANNNNKIKIKCYTDS